MIDKRLQAQIRIWKTNGPSRVDVQCLGGEMARGSRIVGEKTEDLAYLILVECFPTMLESLGLTPRQ